jgi:NADH-quinone oxidoreductase subunit M
MEQNYILTYLLLTPIVGSVLVLFLKNEKKELIRWYALAVSLLAFVISLIVYAGFNSQDTSFQFVHSFIWIKSLNIGYTVGVDGISLL